MDRFVTQLLGALPPGAPAATAAPGANPAGGDGGANDARAAALLAGLSLFAADADRLGDMCRELCLIVVPDGGRVISGVAAAMTRHAGDARLQRLGCHVFTTLSQHSAANVAALLRVGAAALVVSALRAHATDADTLRLGCNALFQLCESSREHLTAVVAAGGVAATVSSMNAAAADMDAQVWGAKTLQSIAFCFSTDEHVATVTSAGGCEALTAMLRTHLNSRQQVVLYAASVALGHLIHEPDGRQRAIRAGAIEALIAVVRAYATQREDVWQHTVASACVGLSDLLCDGEAVAARSAALFRDATPAVLRAMRDADDAPQVQLTACMALCSISETPAQRVALSGADGVLRAVLDALRAHAGDAAVQAHACKALACVCRDSAANAAAAVAAIPAIVAAMRAFGDNVTVQAHACNALAVIVASQPQRQAAARAAGALRAVVAAMRAHAAEALAQLYGCNALGSMTCGCAANGDDAVAAGAIEVVLRCMDRLDDEEGPMLYECTFSALEPLLREGRDPAAHEARAVRAGALETLQRRRQPCKAVCFGEAGLASVAELLTAAAARHDAAACAHDACRRCAAHRASGAVCALPGCGARRRAGDGGAAKKLLRCGACATAAYCGAAHQREDWARHKGECTAAARARTAATAAGVTEQLP
jgi:hypothetical protein